MAAFNVFEILRPSEIISIRDYATSFLRTHKRRPIVLLDMTCLLGQIQSESRKSPRCMAHRLLFQRFAAYVKVGLDLLCIFDGAIVDLVREFSKIEYILRSLSIPHLNTMRRLTPMVKYAKRLCLAFGVPFIDAPAESEIVCAWLQRDGHADAVLTTNPNVLTSGALTVLHYTLPSSESPATSVETHPIRMYRLHHDDANLFAMCSLISRSDWASSFQSVGRATALALSDPRTGLVARLMSLLRARKIGLPGAEAGIELMRQQWREDFIEAVSSRHSFLTPKHMQLIPPSFPDFDRFDEAVYPERKYESYYVLACRDPGFRKPVVPSLQMRIECLEYLWKRRCPSFSRFCKNVGEPPLHDAESKSQLKAALAPVLVANALIHNHEDVDRLLFRVLPQQDDVEVVDSTEIPLLGPDFLIGARVSQTVFQECEWAQVISPELIAKVTLRTTPATSGRVGKLHQRDVSQNSKLWQRFFPQGPAPSAPAARAIPPSSSSLTVNPSTKDSEISSIDNNGSSENDDDDVKSTVLNSMRHHV